MAETMEPSLLPILKLRLLVGFLGERTQFGWWPTAFYDVSGRPFLEPIFSKTSQLAQYHGVVEGARRVHDERLNVGTYHLFRLPEELEQDLHLLIRSDTQELSPTVLFGGEKKALDTIIDYAGSTRNEGIGPVAIGTVDRITDHLRDIASVYARAFSTGVKSFPYLVR
jgi:hypothetical protein